MTTSDSKLAEVNEPDTTTTSTDTSTSDLPPHSARVVSDGNVKPGRSTPESAYAPSASQPSRQSGSGLTWLLLLINLTFIGAAAYGGYFGWTQWQLFQANQQAQIQQSQNETQQLITTELTQQIASQQQRVQQQSSSLTRNVEQQIAAQNSRLQDMLQQIQRLSGTQATSWQTAEAMFLIRMAGRKIWLENNPKTAILLLQQADHQLANITDSRLYLVRQKIAQDIGQLHTLQKTTPDQQVLRLQSLYQSVATLPFAQSALLQARQNRNDVSEGSFWDKAGQWFKNNVLEINRVEQAVKPLITQEHSWLIQEQVKYQLLVSQQALLQSQPEMFRNSLTQITQAVSQHFDINSPNVSSFQTQITEISQHKFATVAPDALTSEAALAQFIQQENQSLPVSTTLSSMPIAAEKKQAGALKGELKGELTQNEEQQAL